MRDPKDLLAPWSSVHNWTTRDAWRFLDLLEELHQAIWSIHEKGLIGLCQLECIDPPDHEDPDDPDDPIPF